MLMRSCWHVVPPTVREQSTGPERPAEKEPCEAWLLATQSAMEPCVMELLAKVPSPSLLVAPEAPPAVSTVESAQMPTAVTARMFEAPSAPARYVAPEVHLTALTAVTRLPPEASLATAPTEALLVTLVQIPMWRAAMWCSTENEQDERGSIIDTMGMGVWMYPHEGQKLPNSPSALHDRTRSCC